MKSIMKIRKIITFFLLFLLSSLCYAQKVEKEYTSMQDALKNPDKVTRLNLSDQDLTNYDKDFSRFKNLTYLNLRHTNLKNVPFEVTTLKNLKVLDLGDNDITLLPRNFDKLKNLEELFLDNDKNLKLREDIEILSRLQSLRILHLENNGFKTLPNNVGKLTQLEKIYLGDNLFEEVPVQFKDLKNLKFIDLHHNPLIIPTDVIKRTHGGIIFEF